MHVIDLGAKVRDTVSGWEGIATARYEYMNGCERYEVSGTDKDGKPEGFTFDWQQLEVDTGAQDEFAQAVWVHAGVPAALVTAEMSRPGVWERATGGPRDNRPVQR